MTAVPSSDSLGSLEESTTRNPVSEALIQGIQGVRNFLLSWIHVEIRFNMNGPYTSFNGQLGVDGIFRFPYKAKIISISVVNKTVGTGGTTEIDFKKASDPQGVWATILTTTAKITSAATSWAFAVTGSAATGCTAPVMITTPFNVNAGDYFRMDPLDVMTGSPRDLSVSIIYSPRV